MAKLWNYHHSLLQVSGSLFHYFGIDRGHGTDQDVDVWLKNKPSCIVALLIDAMGTSILEKHLPKDAFLRKHMRKSVSTVFPPTTTAATTSFLSGKSPLENGWIGWNQYFDEVDDQVILFLNKSQYKDIFYAPGWSETKLPVEKIYDALNEKGIPADSIWPFWSQHNPSDTFDDLLENIRQLSQTNRFLYAYWDAFDDLLHENGTESIIIKKQLQEYNDKLEAFVQTLAEDVSLMVIADHSQINIQHYDLASDEELCSCLRKAPSLEPRTTAFFIKEGRKKEFKEAFITKFADQFLLLTKEEMLSSGILGEGIPHKRIEDFLGDFVAIAKTPLQLDYKKGYQIKGNHAGLVEEERFVPLILYP